MHSWQGLTSAHFPAQLCTFQVCQWDDSSGFSGKRLTFEQKDELSACVRPWWEVGCLGGGWAMLIVKFKWIVVAACFVALRHPIAAKPATLPYRLALAADA